MMTNFFIATLAIFGSAIASIANAQDIPIKVGGLHDVNAWVSAFPGAGGKTLHVKGLVGAGTPCHRTTAEYAGDEKSNPPVYVVKVTTYSVPSMICIQKTSLIPFEYSQPNYIGTHIELKTETNIDSVTVKIGITH